jgi:hypothetical protein
MVGAAQALSNRCCGISATALINSCENDRPRAPPICATSRSGARRWRLVGIATGATDPVTVKCITNYGKSPLLTYPTSSLLP